MFQPLALKLFDLAAEIKFHADASVIELERVLIQVANRTNLPPSTLQGRIRATERKQISRIPYTSIVRAPRRMGPEAPP